MNENIDLCEILKGHEGIKLYTDYHIFEQTGECIFMHIDKILKTIDIKYPPYSSPFFLSFDKHGIMRRTDGSIYHLYPSKEQKDWNEFKKEHNTTKADVAIPIDTPMMCKDEGQNSWVLRYYSGYESDKHFVFAWGEKSSNTKFTTDYMYMIPFDKFNPNDIEESLKYNIQK